MKIYAPKYYKNFKCIADKCKHNCCIGWEIDIDAETEKYYRSVTELNIMDNIEDGHFKLAKNDRCPFLNKNNLCDIILKLGEDKLCQICTDHPRFRNFYDDRVEVGLGLCCEAAAELILTYNDNFELELKEGEETPEDEFFAFRAQLFKILQNRDKALDDRICEMLTCCGVVMPKRSMKIWAQVYLSLERLDEKWTCMLEKLTCADVDLNKVSDNIRERLLIYFIYRHLGEGLYDGRINERILFAVLSTDIICAIVTACDEDVFEVARMYSSEIEYSEENVEALLEILGN